MKSCVEVAGGSHDCGGSLGPIEAAGRQAPRRVALPTGAGLRDSPST